MRSTLRGCSVCLLSSSKDIEFSSGLYLVIGLLSYMGLIILPSSACASFPDLCLYLLFYSFDKADEIILQDTLQVSLVEHKSHEEQEARENVALVDEHLASEEIEKMVDGQENVVDDSSIPRTDESNILGTRIEPQRDKESPEVEIAKEKEVEITQETKEEITNVIIPVNVTDEDEEITDEVYELKRREKGKNVEESRNSPIPTPIRSPRIHSNLVSLDTEKLQELTDTPHTTSSSSSPHKKLTKTNRLLSLFKTKPTRFKRYKSFFHELQGHYGYLFAHLRARFMPRKSIDTLADHLHDVMVESLPDIVDKHVKKQVMQQVPEQTERLIAKAILQERGNIQAQISTQIENAIANVIPSQVNASVRNYMSGHILHVYPAQSQISSIPEQQYQLYLAMKVDPQLQQQNIAIWLALQMKFERHTIIQTACITPAVRPRDQDDPHDDAHPEGENSTKRQKTSKYEAYVSGESSSGQVFQEEQAPSAVKRIFRYLKGQPKLGLWYSKYSPFDLVAYTDSDYPRVRLDRKFTTRGCQFLRCRLISWQCKKQIVVVNSTTKVKYMAASSCCGQLYLILLGKAKKSVRLMMGKLFGMELELILVTQNEAVHKELDNSLVRATTTASSLEAEQDSGNINKTRSKATPNESSSLGTTSGGGPRCQETMGDTTTRTRFKSVSKHSNDSLLTRARVESSDNEESLGEDASKQGRNDAIDADEEITLVNIHDVNVSAGEEVFVAEQDVISTASAATTVSAATTTTATIKTVDNITLAQALDEIKSTKPKKKGVVIQELGESTKTISSQLSSQQSQEKVKGILIEPSKIDADHQLGERMQAQEQEELSIEEKGILFQQLLEKRRKYFAAKRAEEKRKTNSTKDQQRKIMCTYLKNMEGYKLKDLKLKEFDSIQEMFDRAFKRVEDDKEIAKLKQLMKIIPDEEEVAIEAIPLAVKSPSIVDWKIYKEGRKSYYQIIRADGKSQMYTIFSQMLKSSDREDFILDAVRITAAHVCVNAAQLDLVLLMNFKENMLSVYYC
ncbi:hypothetical protein Tco_0053774 [Tanacetum coccineum]